MLNDWIYKWSLSFSFFHPLLIEHGQSKCDLERNKMFSKWKILADSNDARIHFEWHVIECATIVSCLLQSECVSEWVWDFNVWESSCEWVWLYDWCKRMKLPFISIENIVQLTNQLTCMIFFKCMSCSNVLPFYFFVSYDVFLVMRDLFFF